MKSGDLRTLSQADLESQHSIKVLPAQKSKPPKNKNLNKNNLDLNFIAPDGGWGWLVVIVAAISFLVTFDVFKQIEILFRRKAESDEMTTILNIQLVASACTGLFNGALFRHFTFRQISLIGSVLTFAGLTLSVFFDTLTFHILTLSIMCGIGRSLIFSSSAVVVFTYFKEKRISAIACLYSISGLGVLSLPYISKFLLNEFGFQWTLLFFTSLSLHNFISSLIYQSVKLHIKPPRDIEMDQVRPLNLMFGSRQLKKLNALETMTTDSSDDLTSQLSFPSQMAYPLRAPKNSFASFEPLSRPIPKIILPDETEYFESPQEFAEHPRPVVVQQISILQKVSNLFDLGLLKDLSFVNLAFGLTLIHFVETTFADQAPIILSEFGYSKEEIWYAMILLDVCDMAMRMCALVLGRYARWSKKGVLLCAVLGMCIGRATLMFGRRFSLVVFVCFGWMGFCKAIRVIFWMLVLPDNVPLVRLPAAIGFQEVMSCLFTLAMAPFIDQIQSRSVIVNSMNGVCLVVAFLWLAEKSLKRKQKIRLSNI